MSDEPKRRPILSLKNPPKVVLPEGPKKKPARAPAPPAPPPVQHDWKCKPCGAGFSIEASLADEVVIRCPSCNAKLGLVSDFRADPPPAKLRARPTKRA
jgi:DNA-directed RNA polymerase subunit RPC12/RpoP